MAVPNAFDERSIPNLPGVERGDIDLNKTEPKTAVKTEESNGSILQKELQSWQRYWGIRRTSEKQEAMCGL